MQNFTAVGGNFLEEKKLEGANFEIERELKEEFDGIGSQGNRANYEFRLYRTGIKTREEELDLEKNGGLNSRTEVGPLTMQYWQYRMDKEFLDGDAGQTEEHRVEEKGLRYENFTKKQFKTIASDFQ